MTIDQARRPARDAQLLATLAAPLKPDRPPFYLTASEKGHPDGWYMVPHATKRLQYLGRNVYWAQAKLIELRQQQ